MKHPLPKRICDRIANTALIGCRSYAIQRGWKSADKLYAYSISGAAGIKTSAHYLIYQNNGIRPFIMWGLEGKVVPMKDNTGKTHYRKVIDVGEPGVVRIPGDPSIPSPTTYKSRAARPGLKYRVRKWEHPGINATHFIDKEIKSSIKNNRSIIKQLLKTIIGG